MPLLFEDDEKDKETLPKQNEFYSSLNMHDITDVIVSTQKEYGMTLK